LVFGKTPVISLSIKLSLLSARKNNDFSVYTFIKVEGGNTAKRGTGPPSGRGLNAGKN